MLFILSMSLNNCLSLSIYEFRIGKLKVMFSNVKKKKVAKMLANIDNILAIKDCFYDVHTCQLVFAYTRSQNLVYLVNAPSSFTESV